MGRANTFGSGPGAVLRNVPPPNETAVVEKNETYNPAAVVYRVLLCSTLRYLRFRELTNAV